MYRFIAVAALAVVALAAIAAAVADSSLWWILAGPAALLSAVGIYGLIQPWHSILRNYPVLGHLRFLLGALRPESQQYLPLTSRPSVAIPTPARPPQPIGGRLGGLQPGQLHPRRLSRLGLTSPQAAEVTR